MRLLVVTAVLFLFGIRAANEAAVETVLASKWDDHLIELDIQALDHAYAAQIQKLFGIWMSDEHGQPHRAVVGAQRARRAYIAAMTEIERTRR